MPVVLRIDSVPIGKVETTPQGGVRVDAAVTRVGVLRYRDQSGNEWTEFRSPEEVFAADSMASLRSAPVTDGHPAGLVTTENYSALSKGQVSDSVRRDGDFIAAPLVINDAETCRRVLAGERKDVSAGYTCEIDETPGVYEGARFDKQQRRIRYNHAAVLPQGAGRAGAEVSLRMDGAAFSVTRADAANPNGVPMKTITLLGKVYNCDEAGLAQAAVDIGAAKQKTDADAAASGDALAQLQKTVSDLMVQVAMMTAAAKAVAAAAEAEGAAEPMDDGSVGAEEVLDSKGAARLVVARVLGNKPALKGLRADAIRTLVDSAIEKRSAALVKVRADAALVLGTGVDLAGKSETEIHRATVAKLAPAVKLDALDARALASVFEASVAAFGAKPATRADGHDKLRESLEGKRDLRADGTELDPGEKLRRDMEERGRQPLNATGNAAG